MRQVTQDQAIDILYDITGMENITPQTRFGDLGLDSLDIIEWITGLEEQLDTHLEVSTIDFRMWKDRTVGAVLDLIYQHIAQT